MILPNKMNESAVPTQKMQTNLVEAYAKRKMTQKVHGSKTFCLKSKHPLPSFDATEFTLGEVVGHGEFCKVQEIKAVNLDENLSKECSYASSDDLCLGGHGDKDAIRDLKKSMMNSMNGKRSDTKYVIKTLKLSTKLHRTHFQRGLLDLTIEAKALSILSHPNIIKLHGFNEHRLYKHDFFIILERLQATLRQKMDVWKKNDSSRSFIRKLFDRKNAKTVDATLKDKLSIYRDIASALAYMHGLR